MAKLDIECCPICCAPVKAIETCNSVRFEYNGPRWISVEERLPERDKEVLCFFVYPDSTTVCQNVYYGNGHWLGEGSFVTHWMPLPEPPKEE